MRVKILNDWVVEYSDIDLKEATAAEIKLIGSTILSNLCVVIKDQKLTPDEQLTIAKMIGNVETHYDTEETKEQTKHISIADGVTRVTAAENEHGVPGLFNTSDDLEWHCNAAFKRKRHPIIWTYGASGVSGSRTSWLDMTKVFDSLSRHKKYELSQLKVHTGYQYGYGTSDDTIREGIRTVRDGRSTNPFPLVYTNPAGRKGLYFPFYQVFGIEGYTEDKFFEFRDEIMKLAIKDENMYNHDWELGDIVLSEQWLTLHKRWAFDKMDQRMIHRIALDYRKVI
jgi:taurine dioxygenase